MTNVMATLPNIGGALRSTSQFAWCPLRVSCSNAANIGERTTSMQSEFAPGKIPLGDKSPQKCIYSVPGQEMAKHRAKFAWSPLNNVGAVAKPRCKTR